MKSSERITINCLWPLFSSMCPYAISRFFITELLVPKKLSNKVLFNKGNFSCQTSCSISWKVPCLLLNLNTRTWTLELKHSNSNTQTWTQEQQLKGSDNLKGKRQEVCWVVQIENTGSRKFVGLHCGVTFFFLYDSRSKVDYIANRLRAIKTTLS